MRRPALPSHVDAPHAHAPPRAGRAAPIELVDAQGRPAPLKKSRKPRRWTPEEDQQLREAVRRFGERNWKGIAALVGSRDHVQCRQRWQKVLRPG